MKKVLAIMLCLVMIIAVLGGCSKTPATSSDSGTQSGTTSGDASTGDTMTDAEKAIADRKASGKNTKIVYSFFTWVGRPAGTDRIQAAISKHTEEALGIETELLIMDSSSYRQNIPLMFAGGEQVDIFSGNGVGGLTTCINSEYCYDMNQDDLFDKYGSDIKNVLPDWAIEGNVIGGKLVALTTNKDIATLPSFLSIGTEYLDAIGYDYESAAAVNDGEYIVASFDELDPIFEKLAAKFPDKYVFSMTGAGFAGYDSVANDTYGVLMDPTVPEISDLYSSDTYLKLMQRFYRYNQLGYYPPDALTSSVTMGARVGAGECMSMQAAGKIGYRTQVSSECSRPMMCFQAGMGRSGALVPSTACAGVCICICSTTDDPIASMQLLSHFYTCENCANLLLWGEEGVDYQTLDTGHIYFADGVDVNNAEWHHVMNWSMPNQQIGEVWKGDSLEIWEKTNNLNLTAARSAALGFTWDNTDYAMQYTALANVFDQYNKSLSLGFSNPDTTIPEFVAELKKAGLDEYIAAKTEAYDAWAKEKGLK